MTAFIRKRLAMHFARKAVKYINGAVLTFKHHPEGTFGYEKGQVYAAIADVYSKLADAFGGLDSRQEIQ